MTIKADSKRRVVLPDARPGDVFAYENKGNGHFYFIRVGARNSQKKKSRAQIRKAIAECKLKFDWTWDDLRSATRES